MTSISPLSILTSSNSGSVNVSVSTSGGSSTVSAQSAQPDKLDRARKPAPYSRQELYTLSHSAYYPEFLNNLEQFILLTKSLNAKPQLQINALLKTNDLLIPKTTTKISGDKEIDYLPAPYSAVMINNQEALYEELNTAFNTLEEQKRENNDFLLSTETPNGHNASPLITKETHKVLKHIETMLLKAIKYLGFHEVSGAKYAALAVYGNDDNGFHDFALSSNNDPKFQDFGNPEMRRCAEDSMSIIAEENKLNKLKYLFLTRAPYPEGYGNNNNGVFNFSKLVPCKSCLQHLEKLYEDGGNLIIVASINQGKFLEKSLGLNIDSSAKQASENQPQPQNYLLEGQKEGDMRIIYPQGLEHCFIEIPNKNLPRIIVEKDIGTNVLSRGTECQDSRQAFTFGEWLKEQKILRQALESFDTSNFSRKKLINPGENL
jgi:hypothetical protein